MPEDEKVREHPMVDGAAINPYDLPGRPREDDEPEGDTSPPTAEESAPVPGPGDPEHTTLVEIGGDEAVPPIGADADAADDKPKRRRG